MLLVSPSVLVLVLLVPTLFVGMCMLSKLTVIYRSFRLLNRFPRYLRNGPRDRSYTCRPIVVTQSHYVVTGCCKLWPVPATRGDIRWGLWMCSPQRGKRWQKNYLLCRAYTAWNSLPDHLHRMILGFKFHLNKTELFQRTLLLTFASVLDTIL